MNIYVAGPMRGYPEFNFPSFHAAAAQLRAAGHTVFNPAERCCTEYAAIAARDCGIAGSESRAGTAIVESACGLR